MRTFRIKSWGDVEPGDVVVIGDPDMRFDWRVSMVDHSDEMVPTREHKNPAKITMVPSPVVQITYADGRQATWSIHDMDWQRQDTQIWVIRPTSDEDRDRLDDAMAPTDVFQWWTDTRYNPGFTAAP